jgi:hypothetical protein
LSAFKQPKEYLPLFQYPLLSHVSSATTNAMGKCSSNFALGLIVGLFCMVGAIPLQADTLIVAGTINQSTQDGTGAAVNDPSLNNILDGDLYTVNLNFMGSLATPGTFDITGSTLIFNDPAGGAVESSFNFESLTVTLSGAFHQFSLFACLTTGSGCNQGNELDLNFLIPSANLTSANTVAQGVPGLLALDLLEDDGVTDIHGVIADNNFTATPEPAGSVLLGTGLITLGLMQVKRRSKKRPR